jgi:hypothetical protein
MKCPTCGENTPNAWQVLLVQALEPKVGVTAGLSDPSREVRNEHVRTHEVHFDWMHCANQECGQLVVRGHDTRTEFTSGLPLQATDTWTAHPKHHGVRPVSPLVPKDMARDFAEAVSILDLSHRMSAVLARRVLADLLEKYAGLDQFSLTTRIEKFTADTSRPRELRENLHHLREIADFSAHTQTDDQLEPLEIDRAEADWTLDMVERLFDYFIVGPDIDRKLREGMDAKVEAAGRKAIKPLPPDLELPSEPDG